MPEFPSNDTWLANGSGAPATATRAVETGKTHWVHYLHASYDVAQNGTLELRSGAAVLGTWNVKTELTVELPKPIPIRGTAANLVLSGIADTDGTQDGKVVMSGATE